MNQPYYDGVEPVLEALEQVNGDLSDGQRRFADALAHLRYHAPQGLITLDRRHQAIAPIYLGRVVVTGGKADVTQIGVFKHVHETLGGYFSPRSPAPSQTQPACQAAELARDPDRPRESRQAVWWCEAAGPKSSVHEDHLRHGPCRQR